MYDIIIIGSGPGGYPAAIRASQLGLKVALVEKDSLGGVCLNWGCIPTKALLKSASVFEYVKTANQYGITLENPTANLPEIVKRSRDISTQMSKGVEFLLCKHKVEIIKGYAKLTSDTTVDVEGSSYEAKHIILSTGARAKVLPNIPVDGKRIITSKEALVLEEIPASLVVVGSGAIGLEFATFFATLGTKVTIVEYEPNLAPLCDTDISLALERALRKAKITVMTSSSVDKVKTFNDKCIVTINGKKGIQTIECDIVLSAVGITANIENIGLETVGINTEKGKVVVNNNCQTNIPSIYAIGDIIDTPALAHVATFEAVHAVEHIAGLNPKPINYDIVPSCIYTTPEVSSVGLTEAQAIAKGYNIRIGKFPFTASGKAVSAGARDGMVKLIFNADNDEFNDKLLGAHMLGLNVTELIGETTLALQLGATAKDIINTIHAHPTMHEAIMEAAATTHQEAIHII